MTTITEKVRAHFRRYPTANVKEAAAKFNQPLSRIYKLRKEVGEENMRAAVGVPDLVPMPTPEHEASAAASSALKAAMRTEQEDRERAARYFAGFGGKPAAMSNVDETLDERAKEYGKFEDGAALMQGMKRLITAHAHKHGKTFTDDQWESLEMIVHKIGRIVNGNPDKVDHWVDIAGYAKLVADRLQGVAR